MVDHLGVVAIVLACALVLGAVLVRSGAVDTVATALSGGPALSPAAPDRAALAAALAGDALAPGLDDAIAIAALDAGETTVRRLAAALAYDAYGAGALARPLRGAIVTPRRPGRARIVSPADEQRLVGTANATRHRRNRRQAVALAGEVVVSIVSEAYVVGVAAALAGAVVGGPSATGGPDLPPGTAAGDVVLCLPVTWRSTATPPARAVVPPLHPGDRLDPDVPRAAPVAASLVVILRAGRELVHQVVAGDGCTSA